MADEKVTVEDVAKAAPGLLTLMINAHREGLRDYLYRRVLFNSLNRADGTTVLSSIKTEGLKNVADASYDDLDPEIQAAFVKSVTRHFGAVFNQFIGAQIANLRLSKLIVAMRSVEDGATGAEMKQMINDTIAAWDENKT